MLTMHACSLQCIRKRVILRVHFTGTSKNTININNGVDYVCIDVENGTEKSFLRAILIKVAYEG